MYYYSEYDFFFMFIQSINRSDLILERVTLRILIILVVELVEHKTKGIFILFLSNKYSLFSSKSQRST